MKDFTLDSYDFTLPEDLIAQYPPQNRGDSRLMVYDESTDEIIHTHFSSVRDFIPRPSILVLNQSKVIPCRLVVQKTTGGVGEIFVLDLKQKSPGVYSAFIKASGKRKVGDVFYLEKMKMELVAINNNGSFDVFFDLKEMGFLDFLTQYGTLPLPSYIRDGKAQMMDYDRYQTCYAKTAGSVAAPTAGLHFTQDHLEKLSLDQIRPLYVTLHVGAGTFVPVKTQDIRQHQMHSECFSVDRSTQEVLKNNKAPVIAVGTTSLRVLESSYENGSFNFSPEEKSTDIFLHPGVEVKSIDGLITNFHLPKSSLLMLVASLIGREKTLSLYQEAIKNRYRFFSYGDCMLIMRKKRNE